MPLQRRAHKMCFLLGCRDPTRTSVYDWSFEAMFGWLMSISKETVLPGWTWGMAPFTRKLPTPQLFQYQAAEDGPHGPAHADDLQLEEGVGENMTMDDGEAAVAGEDDEEAEESADSRVVGSPVASDDDEVQEIEQPTSPPARRLRSSDAAAGSAGSAAGESDTGAGKRRQEEAPKKTTAKRLRREVVRPEVEGAELSLAATSARPPTYPLPSHGVDTDVSSALARVAAGQQDASAQANVGDVGPTLELTGGRETAALGVVDTDEQPAPQSSAPSVADQAEVDGDDGGDAVAASSGVKVAVAVAPVEKAVAEVAPVARHAAGKRREPDHLPTALEYAEDMDEALKAGQAGCALLRITLEREEQQKVEQAGRIRELERQVADFNRELAKLPFLREKLKNSLPAGMLEEVGGAGQRARHGDGRSPFPRRPVRYV